MTKPSRSEHVDMARSSIKIVALTLLAYLLSMVSQIYIARTFGTSGEMDAYVIGVAAPLAVQNLISNLFTYSLTPYLIRYREEESEYSSVTTLFMVACAACGLLFACVGWVIAGPFLHATNPHLPERTMDYAIAVARASWLVTGLIFMIAMTDAQFNASKRFLWPVIGFLAPYVGQIVAVRFLAHSEGPTSIAYGMLFGFAAYVPIRVLLLRHEFSWRTDRWQANREKLSSYAKGIPLMLIGMLATVSLPAVDAFWAPRLGEAAASYLGYCSRLIVMLGALIAVGPANILVPRLTKAFLAGDHAGFRRDLYRAVRVILCLAVPVSAVFGCFRLPVVQILFQRGQFTLESSQGIAGLLPWMLIGAIGMVVSLFLIKAMYIQERFKTLAWLSVVTVVAYFCLSGIFSRMIGVNGVAVAFMICWWGNAIVMFVTLQDGEFELMRSGDTVTYVQKLAALSVVTLAISWVLRSALIHDLGEVGLVRLLLTTGVACGVVVTGLLFVGVRVLKLGELALLTQSVFGRLTGRREATRA